MNDLRVALCGVGDVGHYAIRGILSRPDMTLVGVQTFSPNKAGRDAAEVIGWDPCGTQPTTLLDDGMPQYRRSAPGRQLDDLTAPTRAARRRLAAKAKLATEQESE